MLSTASNTYFALIDANNFYASCERLFRPDLDHQPIVVLSNNDGCVIARSNEAKDLGVEMGIPFYKIRDLCHRHHIHIFSSNYALYGDLSQRLMDLISAQYSAMEVYSIDEAFILLNPNEQHLIDQLRHDIRQQIGIPVSIGIGPTKTLAKVANYIAKKVLHQPIFTLDQSNIEWLKHIRIEDVWGIGRQWSKKLIALNIHTAQDLANTNPALIQKAFNVVLMRITKELNGISCLALEQPSDKKSILSSKSFSKPLQDYHLINQALSSYCARACQKLRAQQSKAGYIQVFLKTNPFSKKRPQYHNTCGYLLTTPTDDTRLLVSSAKMCLKAIFRNGYTYHKAGIMLSNLQPNHIQQHHLLYDHIDLNDSMMTVLDRINHRFGKNTLKIAAEGLQQQWRPRCQKKSPNYTTRWSEIVQAICH